MKIILNLLFASLLSFSIVACGGDSDDSSSASSGSNGTVNIPGGGEVDATPVNPEKDGDASETTMTGTSSNTGCEDTNGALPGCVK